MGRCGNQPQQFYPQNVEWWETLAIAKATRELDRIAMGPLLAHNQHKGCTLHVSLFEER